MPDEPARAQSISPECLGALRTFAEVRDQIGVRSMRGGMAARYTKDLYRAAQEVNRHCDSSSALYEAADLASGGLLHKARALTASEFIDEYGFNEENGKTKLFQKVDAGESDRQEFERLLAQAEAAMQLQSAEGVEDPARAQSTIPSTSGEVENRRGATGARGASPPSVETTDSQPDEHGLVKVPTDSDAYTPKSEILNAEKWNFLKLTEKKLNKILLDHPEIKRWIPRKQRRSIHRGDWERFARSFSSGGADDPAEIERLKAVVRKNRPGK